MMPRCPWTACAHRATVTATILFPAPTGISTANTSWAAQPASSVRSVVVWPGRGVIPRGTNSMMPCRRGGFGGLAGLLEDGAGAAVDDGVPSYRSEEHT